MTTAREAPVAVDLTDSALYINRELSWLDFNARVLALARDPEIPLLERCKFLAIFTSNLDEFFMVRVAAVQDALEARRMPSTPDKLSREDVLGRIARRVAELAAEQSRIWREELRPALAESGIEVTSVDDLTAGRAPRPGRALRPRGLRRAHAPRRGAGAALPLHLGAVAEPGAAGARPGEGGHASPGSRCHRSCRACSPRGSGWCSSRI